MSPIPLGIALILALYLSNQGRLIGTIWLFLSLLDTNRALARTRSNGRRIGSSTRRKAMKDALTSWIVYLVLHQVEHIPDMLFGWIPLYGPIKAIATIAFLATRSPSSHRLYLSAIVPVLGRYERPIDLTVLLFHSIFVLVSHYALLLPMTAIHSSLQWLAYWARGEKSSISRASGLPTPEAHGEEALRVGEEEDAGGLPGPDPVSEDELDNIIRNAKTPRRKSIKPTGMGTTINVHLSTTPIIEIPKPTTPQTYANTLRPPSPPMTLRRSPRRPSPQSPPHPSHILDLASIFNPNTTLPPPANGPVAGPSRLPIIANPTIPEPSRSAPAPREANILRLKPNTSILHKNTRSDLPSTSVPTRRRRTSATTTKTTLGGSLALHATSKRSVRTIDKPPLIDIDSSKPTSLDLPNPNERLVYPELPDLPPNLVDLPLPSHPVPPVPPDIPITRGTRAVKQLRPVRETASSRARAVGRKRIEGEEKAVVGSKRKASSKDTGGDERLKRVKPSE